MTNKNTILLSIFGQIDNITNTLYKIYEKKTISESALAMLKKIHKRFWHFIKSQETKIQQRKKNDKKKRKRTPDRQR